MGDDLELAAFLAEDGDGTRSCFSWPMTGARRRAEFRGVIAAGTFAIVHTHPHRMGAPSRGDADQAAQVGLPIYVASRSGVWVVEPTGESLEIVRDPRWRSRKGTLRSPGVE
jgi:hypothetical protein